MSKYHILLFDSERITPVICYVQQCSIAIFITNDLKYVRIARGTLKVNILRLLQMNSLRDLAQNRYLKLILPFAINFIGSKYLFMNMKTKIEI